MFCQNQIQASFFFAIVLTVCLLVSSVATAQDSQARMLKLSEEGTEAVMDGRFEEGARKFQQAYEAFPDPVLLKNEMIAWFRANDCNNALPVAARFAESNEATASDRTDVRKVQGICYGRLTEAALEVEDFDLAQSRIDQAMELDLATDERSKIVALQARLDELRPVEDPLVVAPIAPAPAPAPTLGYALAGTGGTIFVGAVIYHVISLNRASELRELQAASGPGARETFEKRQEELAGPQQTARWLVPTLYVVGAGAAAAGVYLILTHPDEPEATGQTRITPLLAPGLAGATFQMNF